MRVNVCHAPSHRSLFQYLTMTMNTCKPWENSEDLLAFTPKICEIQGLCFLQTKNENNIIIKQNAPGFLCQIKHKLVYICNIRQSFIHSLFQHAHFKMLTHSQVEPGRAATGWMSRRAAPINLSRTSLLPHPRRTHLGVKIAACPQADCGDASRLQPTRNEYRVNPLHANAQLAS